jgi:hypothetical protein
MGHRDGAELEAAYKRLGIFHDTGTHGRIAHMPYSRRTLEPAYSLRVKHVTHEPHPLAALNVPVPGRRYPRAFLPPVLQRKKPVVHKGRYIPVRILAENTEYAAFFV